MSTRSLFERGITLIEQIVFMVVISVGVIALVSTMGPMIKASADPMVTKQSLAIAESLLREVMLQPNTWCDPDDANASTAISYATCATNPQSSLGPTPAGETRNGGSGAIFDNVRDYHGFKMDDVADPTGASIVSGYRAEVSVAQAGTVFGFVADAALAVTITVCRTTTPSSDCAGRESFSLTGYRFRYAPRL